MVAPETQTLDALNELDRTLIYVFVVGPGVGEAIAIALPGRGWLMLDGCRTESKFPLEIIFARWRRDDDPLRVLLLTHPHSDHCEGVPHLIETVEPQWLGVAATDPPSRALSFEAIMLPRQARSTSERLTTDAVREAVIAIQRWHEDHPDRLLLLYDGVELPLGPSPVSAYVRAPDRAGLERFLTEHGREKRLRQHANHISTVIELCFGDARIVLGSDLPRYWPGTTRTVDTGWDSVLSTHPQVGSHCMLKIPHHGSREAQHPALMMTTATDTAWCVTPYNRSRLPRLEQGDGLDLLLERVPSVYLTAVPASKAVQAQQPEPGRVHLAQLRMRTDLQRKGSGFLDRGVKIQPGTACGPLDAIWCFAIDRHGAIRGQWRGNAGLEVVRDPGGT